MAQTKISGKFYPLQHQEWLRACQELKPSERDVLYYLRTFDPYDNGIKINCAEVARQLSTKDKTVHRQTVSRALKALDSKGFIDLELIQVEVKVNPKGYWCVNDKTSNSQQEGLWADAGSAPCKPRAELIETPGCDETPQWIATHRDGSPHTTVDRHTPIGLPQFPHQANFSPPYKTNKDFSKTLSEAERVEQKTNSNRDMSWEDLLAKWSDLIPKGHEKSVISHCESEANSLPQAPRLIVSWADKHFNELISLYRKRYGLDKSSAAPVVQNNSEVISSSPEEKRCSPEEKPRDESIEREEKASSEMRHALSGAKEKGLIIDFYYSSIHNCDCVVLANRDIVPIEQFLRNSELKTNLNECCSLDELPY
jgi:hypothetical protein